MAVDGAYLAYQIRRTIRPVLYAFSQWVDEYVIPVCNDFEAKAETLQRESAENRMARANPEWADMADIAEQSFDDGLELYLTLSSLYQGSLNLFTLGLFHLLEQQLAAITHDCAIDNQIDDSMLNKIVEYYRDRMGINLKTFQSWPKIEELRLVANTIKHGRGPAADALRKLNPKIFEYPSLRRESHFKQPDDYQIRSPLGGEDLYVTSQDFKTYKTAVSRVFDQLLEHFESNRDKSFPNQASGPAFRRFCEGWGS